MMRTERLRKRTSVAKRRGVSTVRRAEEGEASESLGQRVSRLRKERGITQVELAATLGISQPVVSLYERDGLAFRWDHLVALARLLRVSADELLGIKAETAPRRGPKDTRVAKLLREVESLPRRDRDALIRTIEAFLRPRPTDRH